MRRLSFPITGILFSLMFLTSPLAASSSELAEQAAQMLSPDRWAQAVRIDNTNDSSRYPETVYATVFEFNDTLWFYTSTGTQPIAKSRGRPDKYKDNLLPLFRTIDRGFTSFMKLSPLPPEESGDFPSLKNGCVVESIISLDELKQQGTPILQAKLLLYTSKNPRRSSGRRATGHCVLVYQTPSGMHYIDPPKIDVTGTLQEVLEWDPEGIATEIESHYGDIEIGKAFFEPFDLPQQEFARSS